MGYSVLITPEASKQVEQAVEYYSEHVRNCCIYLQIRGVPTISFQKSANG